MTKKNADLISVSLEQEINKGRQILKLTFTEQQKEYEALVRETAQILAEGTEQGSFVLMAREEKAGIPGYRFEKKDDVLYIEYADRTDLCRALLAAAQSAKKSGSESRSFTELGYMADCSRNGVLRVESIKELIRTLSMMGYHFLGLYIEDTIRVEGEPYTGYMRGAYSKEEIQEAVAYGEIFGMEIRPYVQTLAHFNQLTRYPRYQAFIDTADILLAEDERTYAFLDRYLGSVAAAFSSKRINIGMDEAHMIGLGKYLDIHGYQDRIGIMQRHLDRVLEICRKYGLQPQMWSDMFFRLSQGGDYYAAGGAKAADNTKIEIPEGVELAYWDYYSTDEAHYGKMLDSHFALTSHITFAGGAWKWSGFTPNNHYSITIGKAAMTACKKKGISSVVITGWGDNGTEASQFSTLPALFADANEAYGGALTHEDFRTLTSISWEDYMLSDIANPDAEKPGTLNNASKFLFYNDPFTGTFDSVAASLKESYYKEAVEKLDAALIRSEKSRFSQVLRTQAGLCQALTMKADLGIRLRKAYLAGDKETLRLVGEMEIPELAVELDAFYHAFKEQWYKENKTFGFDVQSIRIGGLRQRLIEVGESLRNYVNGVTDRIEELEEPLLPFAYGWNGEAPERELTKLAYFEWANITTPSAL